MMLLKVNIWKLKSQNNQNQDPMSIISNLKPGDTMPIEFQRIKEKFEKSKKKQISNRRGTINTTDSRFSYLQNKFGDVRKSTRSGSVIFGENFSSPTTKNIQQLNNSVKLSEYTPKNHDLSQKSNFKLNLSKAPISRNYAQSVASHEHRGGETVNNCTLCSEKKVKIAMGDKSIMQMRNNHNIGNER